MSTINPTTAPALLFTHLPRPPIETSPGCYAYHQGWNPSSDSQFGFYIGSHDLLDTHVRITLEVLHQAEAAVWVPVESLLPLARALVDAHNHLSMPPSADSTE